MNTPQTHVLPALPITMDALMFRHGRWRVLWAALGGFPRADAIRKDVANLTPHLRRDVGLEPGSRPRPSLELVR